MKGLQCFCMVEKVVAEVSRGGDHDRTVSKQVNPESDIEVEINEVEPDEFMCRESDDCDFTTDSKQGRNSHERQAH